MKMVSNRIALVNQRLFQELCITRSDRFLYPMMKIRETLLELPKLSEITPAMQYIVENPMQEHWNIFVAMVQDSRLSTSKFIENLEASKLKDFYYEVDKLLLNNHLGLEWKKPIIILIVSGIFMPPFCNLSIKSSKENKTLFLELNSRTSLEDIKNAWELIESQKLDVFGKVNKRNLTDKAVDNLVTLHKMSEIQRKNPKLKGLDLIGKLYPQKGDEKIPSPKEDKNTANRLRQIKSRFNRKV